MRYVIVAATVLWSALICLLPAPKIVTAAGEKQQPGKSQFEKDQGRGWRDLLKDERNRAVRGLGYWRRVPLPAGTELKKGNPWSYDEENHRIVCKGEGYLEALLYDYRFGDGIFHVEWRLKKVSGDPKYNSGIFVRTSADAKRWHQAQVGNLNVGYLFGYMRPGAEKYSTKLDGPQRGNPAGEWNTYEITTKGKKITLWVNGYQTATKICEHNRGQIGLQAENFEIEFKNLMWKYLSNEK
ncbi:MAG: DUF1080 domain-containing protein [Gemmataceae bacterium]